jgi:hypothetical protein
MPRVYDKQGNELTVGARVKRKTLSTGEWAPETVIRIAWQPQRGWCVFTAMASVSGSPSDARDTYICRDLLPIDSPTEGKEG